MKKYKVHISFRVTSSVLRPAIDIFDMGAEPNLIGT